jgi:hypothetical protein
VTNTLGLEQLPGRCIYGYAGIQHPTLCSCNHEVDEWALFRRALTHVAREHDGLIRQTHMRAKIRGAIEHKHIGTFYARAAREGLIHRDGHETSDDRAGKNAGRLEPRYRLGPAPTA